MVVSIMKTKFRYDYNYKMLIIYSFISTIFLILFVNSYEKSLIVFCILGIAFLICLFYSFIIINNQGIILGKKYILIIDYFWFTKINLIDLKRVELIEIKKEKKSNWYGLLNEFYHRSTYMYNSNYVYNNGRVFKIIFYLKDNSKRESYFGWMYKERNIVRVNKIINKLDNFICKINLIVQETSKKL